jgi:hypothetical protein
MAKNCRKCGENVRDLTRCPKCGKKIRSKKPFVVITLLLIVLYGGFALYENNPQILNDIMNSKKVATTKKTSTSSIFKNNKDYLTKTITEENYEQIMNELNGELRNNEDIYYCSYSTMYYIIKDGMASAFTNDETLNKDMYKNIYGKTVKQLIEEGKQLMKSENITLEDFKKQLQDASSQ